MNSALISGSWYNRSKKFTISCAMELNVWQVYTFQAPAQLHLMVVKPMTLIKSSVHKRCIDPSMWRVFLRNTQTSRTESSAFPTKIKKRRSLNLDSSKNWSESAPPQWKSECFPFMGVGHLSAAVSIGRTNDSFNWPVGPYPNNILIFSNHARSALWSSVCPLK